MGAVKAIAGGVAFVAVAAGLAFHGAAEPPIGRYTATAIDALSGRELPGEFTTLVFNPCGSGCTHLVSAEGEFDLHLRDNMWKTADGEACSHNVNARLIWTHSCTGPAVRAQLTKSA